MREETGRFVCEGPELSLWVASLDEIHELRSLTQLRFWNPHLGDDLLGLLGVEAPGRDDDDVRVRFRGPTWVVVSPSRDPPTLRMPAPEESVQVPAVCRKSGVGAVLQWCSMTRSTRLYSFASSALMK